jgi:Homeodomain-like domain
MIKSIRRQAHGRPSRIRVYGFPWASSGPTMLRRSVILLGEPLPAPSMRLIVFSIRIPSQGCGHSGYMRFKAANGLAGLRSAQWRPAAAEENPARRRAATAVFRRVAETWADVSARSLWASSFTVTSRTWCTVIAARLDVHAGAVSRWRKRFAQEGMSGLADWQRSGRPRVFPAAVVAEVKAMACEPPEDRDVPQSRRTWPRRPRKRAWWSPWRGRRCSGGWMPTRSAHGGTGRGSSPAMRSCA